VQRFRSLFRSRDKEGITYTVGLHVIVWKHFLHPIITGPPT